LPAITTGHATTGASVVMAVKGILQKGGRVIEQERVGFIGIGSVGITTLRLMLKCLPHPKEITLCDIYSKIEFLEKIRKDILNDTGFRGKVHIAASHGMTPSEIYNSSLIVGATNVPDILDISRVKAGTMIVDDSAPHCFVSELAIQRLRSQEDILFTEGGVLRSPYAVNHLIYLPRHLEKSIPLSDMPNLGTNEITGCIFSGLLSSRFEDIKPTVGLTEMDVCLQHYGILDRLDFQSADLHCEEYVLPKELILNFRRCFGRSEESETN